MVSILPPKRGPWNTIADAMSKLGQNAPELLERRYQTQQGLNAIDELQKGLEEAGGDINKILPALAKAYTLNPNLERSGIGQTFLQQAKAGKGTTAVNDLISQIQGGNKQELPSFMQKPGQQSQMQPSQQPQIQQQQDQPKNIQQTSEKPSLPEAKPGQGIFLSKFLPQDLGQLITPEQKASALDKVAKSGGDVQLARQQIDDYNQGKISQNDLENSNVEKQAANVQRMLGFEDQIRKRISDYLPQDTPEAEKNIYQNMIRPVLEKSESFSDAWQKVSEKIDNFRKLNEAFVKNIPDANIQGISKEQEKIQRESAKPIMKIDPLAYNIIEQAYQQKGHSPITVSKTFKPTPQNVEKTINGAGDYKELIYPKPGFFSSFSEKDMLRNLDRANEGQQKDINKISPELRKEWNEDISLLNIYADLKSKGWSLQNITTLLDDLSDKFSSRQQADRAMLNQDMRVPPRYLGLFE